MMFPWVVLFLAITAQAETPAQDDPALPRIVRDLQPPPNGLMRCLRRLPAGTEINARMTCRVNAIAGATGCTFDPDTLSREERYAAVCYSRGFRFRYENGRSATGRTVTYRVRMSVPKLSAPSPDA